MSQRATPGSYEYLVERISNAIIAPMAHAESPLDAVMVASDVAAAVIMAYPRDTWEPVLETFVKRLAGIIERKAREGTN